MSGITSVLNETRLFPPNQDFVDRANIQGMAQYQALCEKADANYEGYWASLAREHIDWKQPFTQVFDGSKAPFYEWFGDGVLNLSYNCLDRHLPHKAEQTALIFEHDDGNSERISYQNLYERVCQFANGLKSLGVGKGDRVAIYMPMVPDAIVAMQACARIGAIHSVVFAGFSAASLRERIQDAEAKVVITATESIRGGKRIPLKSMVDQALGTDHCPSIEAVIVLRHSNIELDWVTKRDHWWHELAAAQPKACEPEWLNAEDTAFILYTSGSTGKPKGVVHSVGGYLLGAILTMKWVFDHHPNDVFWCTADVGWITGHTYVAYGPLAVGATQLIFEGVPTFPDANRFWQVIAKHQVTVFYTAPTAIRALIKLGSDFPLQHDLSSLRLLGTVGEPINPEAWMWYHQIVGQGRCPIVDTWWQTETGANAITPLPGVVDTKPGSCTLALPGIAADIVDEAGGPVAAGTGGLLVIKKPFPFLLRTLWRDPERFKKTYYPSELGGDTYLAGDSAYRDEQGYFWIMGRIDDVLSVSGHRLGTMEIESALVANPLVAEAAVVSKPDPITGEAIVAFVVLKGATPEGEDALIIAAELKTWVVHQIGKIAQPNDIRFGDSLPKTRSGKIMRRLLRSVAKGEAITQDISTLENPGIMAQLANKL